MIINRLKNPYRISLIISVWIYTFSIVYAYLNYLNPVWGYYGFTYSSSNQAQYILIFGLATYSALLMPIYIASASSIVLLLMFLVVYIPAVVITCMLKVAWIGQYFLPVMTFGIVFPLISFFIKQPKALNGILRVPGRAFERVILIIWTICILILLVVYFPVMKFSGLDDVYAQRAAAAGGGIFISYIKSYMSSVLSPALIAFGLLTSRKYLYIFGVIGCLVMYMIAAQRTVFLIPVVMTFLYYFLTAKSKFLKTTSLPLIIFSVLIIISTSFYEKSFFANLIATYFVFRTIALPGLSFSIYNDLFGGGGYTWWTHVKGVSLFIDPPLLFSSNKNWPDLGFIVGDFVYDSVGSNYNANLFSGDGLAAAGAFGIIVISIIFGVWLKILDYSMRNWSSVFAILIVFPIGNSLTNGHFFTAMISFGGMFWIIYSWLSSHSLVFGKQNIMKYDPEFTK